MSELFLPILARTVTCSRAIHFRLSQATLKAAP